MDTSTRKEEVAGRGGSENSSSDERRKRSHEDGSTCEKSDTQRSSTSHANPTKVAKIPSASPPAKTTPAKTTPMSTAVVKVLRQMQLHKSWRIAAAEVQTIRELAGLSEDEPSFLKQMVDHAATFSYSPVSQFRVGAVGIGVSGDLYLGTNIEYPGSDLASAIHGEQCVAANMFLAGEKGMQKLAVNAAPCGHCRQFLCELPNAKHVEVIVSGEPSYMLVDLLRNPFLTTDVIPSALPLLRHKKFRVKQESVHRVPMLHSLHTLLADGAQDESALSKDQREAQKEKDRAESPENEDEVSEVAVEVYASLAAAMSYSPMSLTACGVALLTSEKVGGKVITGSWLESAAFNPSLPPLQVATINLHLHGLSWADVDAIALAEGSGNAYPARLLPATLATLSSIPELQHIKHIKYIKLHVEAPPSEPSTEHEGKE